MSDDCKAQTNTAAKEQRNAQLSSNLGHSNNSKESSSLYLCTTNSSLIDDELTVKFSNKTARKLSPLLVKKPHLITNDPQTIKSTLSPHGSTYSKMTDSFRLPESINTSHPSTGTKIMVEENLNTSPEKSVLVPVGAGLMIWKGWNFKKSENNEN